MSHDEHSHDGKREDLRAQLDVIFGEVYFCSDASKVTTSLEILSAADEASHMRMALAAGLTGADSPTSIVELTTHVAVADLRLRVIEHLEALEKAEPTTSAQAKREATHAAMKASIQLLYVAEPPEFLEVNGADAPLDERHADLLASWLLGEGWHR